MARKPQRPRRRELVGIRRIATGWQAYVRVRGRFISRVFPSATAVTIMRRWREEQKVRARLGAALPPAGATLGEDVRAYLLQVQTMPTLRHRRDDLQRWIRAFGADRPRQSITAGEIREQLETWRAEGYAPSTCNHRRTALMHLWSVLDGKSAPNPARDVPRYQDAPGPPRALSPSAVAALLDAMPGSLTRARLELMRWTGWPQTQISKLTPTDIEWDRAVFVTARRKGKGVAGSWLPLLPPAWSALRAFKAAGAWGKFSTSSARKSLRVAARAARRKVAAAYVQRPTDRADLRQLRAELLNVTPYQLRHSFLTLVAGLTTDDRAVMALGQHADIRTSHRYTGAVVNPRVAAAMQKVAAALQANQN
jgi:site-specific recombinase XerD